MKAVDFIKQAHELQVFDYQIKECCNCSGWSYKNIYYLFYNEALESGRLYATLDMTNEYHMRLYSALQASGHVASCGFALFDENHQLVGTFYLYGLE